MPKFDSRLSAMSSCSFCSGVFSGTPSSVSLSSSVTMRCSARRFSAASCAGVRPPVGVVAAGTGVDGGSETAPTSSLIFRLSGGSGFFCSGETRKPRSRAICSAVFCGSDGPLLAAAIAAPGSDPKAVSTEARPRPDRSSVLSSSRFWVTFLASPGARVSSCSPRISEPARCARPKIPPLIPLPTRALSKPVEPEMPPARPPTICDGMAYSGASILAASL